MTLATSLIMYFDLSCSALHAFLIFCFFSMVSLTVIVMEFSTTPRKLTSWDGIRHDFSGWGQNPRSTNSFNVSSTVVRHSV